jgi:LuxR family maltose regulon positive regulatory protein
LIAAREDREAALAIAAAPPCVGAIVLAARGALARGDTDAARELLHPALDQPEPVDTAGRIEALVLYAVASRALPDRDVAADAFERALALADRDQFVWPFLQAGPPLRDLLARQIRRGTSHRGLVERLRVEVERDAVTSRPVPLLEPLSEREQRVLSYLETMLSTEEIAGELFVSTNTVKSHVKSIYRKLGVTRRRQAVLRARTLQLL